MRLLNEAEVAEQIQCKVSALRKWRNEGRGPAFIKVGRLVRYRLADLEFYLEQNRHGEPAPKKAQLSVISS